MHGNWDGTNDNSILILKKVFVEKINASQCLTLGKKSELKYKALPHDSVEKKKTIMIGIVAPLVLTSF